MSDVDERHRMADSEGCRVRESCRGADLVDFRACRSATRPSVAVAWSPGRFRSAVLGVCAVRRRHRARRPQRARGGRALRGRLGAQRLRRRCTRSSPPTPRRRSRSRSSRPPTRRRQSTATIAAVDDRRDREGSRPRRATTRRSCRSPPTRTPGARSTGEIADPDDATGSSPGSRTWSSPASPRARPSPGRPERRRAPTSSPRTARRSPRGRPPRASSPLGARGAPRSPAPIDTAARRGGRELRGRGLPAALAHRHQRPRAGVQRPSRRAAERPAPRRCRKARTVRLAGRELASGQPVPGKPVKTTIDPDLQEAAVTALGDQFGGVAALDARDGSVKALAGIAFSAPQPPGSTFKVITTSAALEDGLGQAPPTSSRSRPAAVIEGREVANAHDELCGGTFVGVVRASPATACSPRSASRSARSGWSPRPRSSASTRGRRSTTTRRLEAVDAAREHDPVRRRDRRRPRRRRQRHRPGRGAGDAAPAGLGGADDRRGRHPQPDPDHQGPRAHAPTPSRCEVMDAETAKTLRELMIGVVDDRDRDRRRPADRAGRRKDGHGRARRRRRSSRARSWARARSPSRRWTPGSRPSRPPRTRSSRSRRWS